MGQFIGEYSRAYPGMYDEEKRYLGILPQRSVSGNRKPVVDADLMDHLLSQFHNLRLFMEEVLGSGSPGDGFQIIQASSAINDFQIKASSFYNNGLRARISDDSNYTSDGSHPNDIHAVSTGLSETVLTDTAARWDVNELVGRKLIPDTSNSGNEYTITANTENTITVGGADEMVTDGASPGDIYRVTLTTPTSGNRTDTVYLDCYLDEVDVDEDGNLLHDIDGSFYETCNRLKIRQMVKVREGSTDIPANGADSDGNYHWYVKLAELNRLDGNNSILTAMIDDWRLDIKRAFYQVPTLDVGGGYGDVVDGGLSVDAQGNLETDGEGTFDDSLKVTKSAGNIVHIGYDKDLNALGGDFIETSFGDGITEVNKISVGNSTFQGSVGNKSFNFNKAITIEAKDDSGNVDDTFLHIAARSSGKIAALIFNTQHTSDIAVPKIYSDASDAPNKLKFEIIQVNGGMAWNPMYYFTSDQELTEMYLDGHSMVRDRITLNPDNISQPSYFSFKGKGTIGVGIPYIGFNIDSSHFYDNKFAMNRNLILDGILGGISPELYIISPDTDTIRRSRIVLDSPDTSGDRYVFDVQIGPNSLGTPHVDEPTFVNFGIDSGYYGGLSPDMFCFFSKNRPPDETLMEVVGNFTAYGSRTVLNHQTMAKSDAQTEIHFYHLPYGTLRNDAKIVFIGASNLFRFYEDLSVNKMRNEDSYLNVTGYSDKKAFLEIIGERGGANAAINRFRIHASEEVAIGGGNTDVNFVTFASRWGDSEFGGTGDTTKAIFRFQNRKTDNSARAGLAWIHLDGHYLQKGNTLTIKHGEISPESFIVFGQWNIDTQSPADARMSLHANPSGYADWLKLKNRGTAGNRGMNIDGHLMLDEVSSITNTTASGKVSMWVNSAGRLFVKVGSTGTTYEFTGVEVV
jgi:hypothetical protein